MPEAKHIGRWMDTIRRRYENYLRTSFYFKDPELRASFQSALQGGDELLKGPFPEKASGFREVDGAWALARYYFHGNSSELEPALRERKDTLYAHQDRAVRATHAEQRNIVVATGTASGKTESFLYPILFALYRQYLDRQLDEPGVRALILYPMNALANDQRKRLGEIFRSLQKEKSGFAPTFGQYIGQTPKHKRDRWRNASTREEERLPGEMVFREEMRNSPPHILLTNYSMLEYLLIRPKDSPLFDNGSGRHWQFIVLDEAHQYRGAKGMEMGMLIRRLKQRVRDGGRGEYPFRCIATSATIASGDGETDKQAVADFAGELFGEPFSTQGIILGEHKPEPPHKDEPQESDIRCFHVFARALEGAFLVHDSGKDAVVLNRKKTQAEDGLYTESLEIALCRECGQHYYVGREENGMLMEAVRDPSQSDFGVEYYLPLEAKTVGSHFLCRRCGKLSTVEHDCECAAAIPVRKCESHGEHLDRLKECEICGYRRGGIGDPVQEIVHGSDGPNAVIATALHELLPEDRRKVLAFADSRQEAAFFAWYAQDSYTEVRDRNLMLRALHADKVESEGLSIADLRNRLVKQWEAAGMFDPNKTATERNRTALTAIFREALTDEKRVSLAGVGLAKWFVNLPHNLKPPELLREAPWDLGDWEARQLLSYLLDELRARRAMAWPERADDPNWKDVSSRPQRAYGQGSPGGRRNVAEWGSDNSAIVKHFLCRVLAETGLSCAEKRQSSMTLMKAVWSAVRDYDKTQPEASQVLLRAGTDGTFRLNSDCLRIQPVEPDGLFECDVCASLTSHNIRGVCPRNGCPGQLAPADHKRFKENHYRILYENPDLPPSLRSEEHTAQINSDAARKRQDEFKKGDIHLLSSSTTFEVGVDLGDLEAVFLRNVPPEPFNYTQRVGRAGRRETPGFALTYCRRNPHDLYHYENPKARIFSGSVQPPRLRMTNQKIISRHMAALALSAFFKDAANLERFRNAETFFGDWADHRAVSDLNLFCKNNMALKDSLRQIVPEDMHQKTGLDGEMWIGDIAGPDSRLAWVAETISADYCEMEKLEAKYSSNRQYTKARDIKKRMDTIANEQTLTLLSRTAIIPKYGFPVDVVELDTRPRDGQSTSIVLQRDLSQAIAEYAPGGKVVANKKEWESCGVKTIPGRQFPIKRYAYDDARNFKQWDENAEPPHGKKYLSPVFGFVTPLLKNAKEPSGRAQRLYTTRPFFQGFDNDTQPETRELLGVKVTQALPGSLVVLCEGRNKAGFYICRTCGSHMKGPKKSHKTPSESDCRGRLEPFSLGHELVTDVLRLQFPQLNDQWDAYSLAYAILLGAAETLNVPGNDLNTTITGGENDNQTSIVLYDAVPGGAGLVAQLEEERILRTVFRNARARVQGRCGCDLSCYGCLRSYRNQFAHPHLHRENALTFLDAALSWTIGPA